MKREQRERERETKELYHQQKREEVDFLAEIENRSSRFSGRNREWKK